jgi:uncharacterized protein (DUF2141 family)
MLVCLSSGSAPAADLKVHIIGLRSTQGVMRLSLYDQAETFLQAEGRLVSANLMRLQAAGASICFADLPPGQYAITVHHDENNDGKLNRNFVGIPLEGYGFSNDARSTLGPPSFTKAAVTLQNQDQVITITLRY